MGALGGGLEMALAGGWAASRFPEARAGAACMPGLRRAWGHQEVEGRGPCLFMDRVGKGPLGFPNPGAGGGWRWVAVLTSKGAQTSLEAGVGLQGKQRKAQVLPPVSGPLRSYREALPTPAAPARLGLERPEDLCPL